MSKVAVVYWSGTGNTKKMADAVVEGAKNAGAEVELIECSSFDASRISEFDGIGFGCPSMGVEVLEESSFEPMFESCENSLGGKKVALFGSYGWGDGEWMRDWEDRCNGKGINLTSDCVICQESPSADVVEDLKVLGASLA
ncbi:MAG: flavodoxin [Firmicutes bacterium]|nr:flavodoxin [Bacillota bacterium]